MASEILLPDEDISGTYTIVGGATGYGVLSDGSDGTYIHNGSSIPKIGIESPSLSGSLYGITLQATYRNFEASFIGLVSLLNNRSSEDFLLSLVLPVSSGAIATVSNTYGSLDLTDSDVDDLFIKFSTYALNVQLIEVQVRLFTNPTIGYETPPPPIPGFLLSPPKRRFVYPIQS